MVKTFLASCLLFGLLSLPLIGQTQNGKDPRIEKYLQKADSLLDQELTSQAREIYRMVLGVDADNTVALYKIGRSYIYDYFDARDKPAYLDTAIDYSHIARSIDPAFMQAYANEALAYRLRWRHGMVRKVLLEAIEHLPEDPTILMLLGRNYFDTGNPGLALPYLMRSIELGGENAPDAAYRFIGWCWFYLEKHDRQLEYFSRFRELNPKSLMGIAGHIHSYTGLGDFDKATALAIQIKENNPDYEYPAFLEAYIAESLLFGGKFDEAITYYEKAIALDPNTDNLFATRAVTTTLGYLFIQKGEAEKGKKLLEKTIERRMKEWKEMPERWEFSFDLASAYAAIGDLNQAYQWLYTSILTGYPGHLWSRDPVFSACHEIFPFRELVKQARIRVENEYKG